MSGPAAIDLSVQQRTLVQAILRAHLPAGAKVWVFGSRASGHAKPYSDLDLAIDAGHRLSLDETAALAEAFGESDLPWKVDVLDWQAADPGFRRRIAASRRPLAEEAPSPDRRSPQAA